MRSAQVCFFPDQRATLSPHVNGINSACNSIPGRSEATPDLCHPPRFQPHLQHKQPGLGLRACSAYPTPARLNHNPGPLTLYQGGERRLGVISRPPSASGPALFPVFPMRCDLCY